MTILLINPISVMPLYINLVTLLIQAINWMLASLYIYILYIFLVFWSNSRKLGDITHAPELMYMNCDLISHQTIYTEFWEPPEPLLNFHLIWSTNKPFNPKNVVSKIIAICYTTLTKYPASMTCKHDLTQLGKGEFSKMFNGSLTLLCYIEAKSLKTRT